MNPEDYMPGLPVNSNTGKAMAAGFEPPALPSLVSESGEILV